MLDAKNSKKRILARSPDAVTSVGQEIFVSEVKFDIFEQMKMQFEFLNFSIF